MIRILITGSRDIDPEAERIVRAVLSDASVRAARVDSEVVIVHGAARGVDTIAALYAGSMGEPHPADWSLGRRAGMLRNQQMVDLGAAVCLAFPRRSSVGTWGCIRAAADAGIPVQIYPLPEIS